MIDAHAHLQEPPLSEMLDDVLKRAKDAGVKLIINASTDIEDSIKALDLLSSKEMVKIVIGLAPYGNLKNIDKMLDLIEKSIEEDLIVGIGEIGLDYRNGKQEEQIPVFKAQVDLAKEYDVPVVIHSRSAGKYAIELLEKWRAERVQLHSFDGSVKYARKAFDLGYYFSFPITTLVVKQKQKILKEIPEELILFETDSPVQNPFVEVNEPAYIKKVYEFAAEVKGLNFDDLVKIVERNVSKLYKW